MKKILVFWLVLMMLSGCSSLQQDTGIPGQGDSTPFLESTQDPPTLVFAPPDEPYQTSDPNAPTKTLNPAIPTLTATITLAPTITPTATLDPEDPISYLGDPWFRDNFATGLNFFLYNEPQSSYLVENNQMILVAKKANNYETWSLAAPTLYNFYLEITGTFGPECAGKDRYGMLFRAPNTSEGYLISLSCDGSYRLTAWDNEEQTYTSLQPWTESEYIHSGPGAVNRLGIETSGMTLSVYTNGHKIFEVEDSTFAAGRFGIMVAAEVTPGFTASLSEAVYWALK
jgi:hypothetical protein